MFPWGQPQSGGETVMNNFDEPVPKPFDFVPVPGIVNTQPAPGHHGINENGKQRMFTMRLVFTATFLRPVHVGTGTYRLGKVENELEAVLEHTSIRRYREGKTVGLLAIPGSSLKGAIRSIVEAITNSCLPVSDVKTKKALPELSACSGSGKLCPACSLFGAQGYLGRIACHDVLVPRQKMGAVKIPNLWQPARGQKLPGFYFPKGRQRSPDRLGSGNPGRKFYYHRRPAEGPVVRMVCRRGTTATITIDLNPGNLAEAGLILCALGCHPQHDFPLKIGAGKPVGLGSVQIKPHEVFIYDEAGKAAGRLGSQYHQVTADALDSWVKSAVQAALTPLKGQPLVDLDRLQQLAFIYSQDGLSEKAPSGVY
jgi:hypothetical protein